MTTNPHEPPNFRDCWWSWNSPAAQQVDSFWQLSYELSWCCPHSNVWQAWVEPPGRWPDSLARQPKLAANENRLNWFDVVIDIAAVEQATVGIADTAAGPVVVGVLVDSVATKPGRHLQHLFDLHLFDLHLLD